MANVLIVEDEPAIAESLSFALRRDGFAVDIADCLAQVNGKIDLADLVLLDLMLPDGSGFDLIVQIRRRALRPAIIVLSSRDEEADRVAALESGADDYVTKPFSPREVVARVRAVLRRAQPFEAPELHLSCSSIQVDVTTRRAVVQGTVLELTRVEFDLLACLIEEPGRVYTRSQLIDKVWGDGFAITDRTVDSHVKGLRKKMVEAGGDPNLVETVRGVGYRIALVSSVQSEP
ncbi:MAG TPA: response regulator transcription factor [Polyangiaceae bacterium]|jgi:two-component system catabolic regulation response regulator CreB|nr:MAG: Phosphate regulon transcriptional regulatory protein PhoB [Deltaproteobacteria bacterium ADurb.Bin207]HNS98920.1 response regulator transcription factor [Polyangiaceae bacterium]HNZ24884.1 response regulator transcription factor [Polyangiaceae bacterium]HOD24584.1 response regulator transcription factor [Polyangiaceae bacterium]HOE50227.1 response regulator transcription factor [Polyangiaceae bacterium]